MSNVWDYITIGSSPVDEPCAQVGDPNYYANAMSECKRFITAIRETLGNEPPNARLKIKGFPHDFGTYYEVVCVYLTDDMNAVEYAYKCESESPTRWTESTIR